MADNPKDISFTPKQLAWLEQQYPQMVHGPQSSEGDMRYYFGQQSVIVAVRKRTRGSANGFD